MQNTKEKKNNILYMTTPIFSKQTYQLLIFFITYSTFTSLHSSRSAWSYSKTNLEKDSLYHDIDDYYLGTVDFIFMLFYGIGLFVSGYIGDKFSLKKMLVMGMALCTFFFFLIFLCRASNDSNSKAIIAFMCFNGLFQSTGFPACVTILGNWISKKTKGRVYGIWSSCHNIGNIVGFVFGMIANDNTDIGWQYSILFSSLFMFINTVLIGVFVVSNPIMAGFTDNNRVQRNKSDVVIKPNDQNPHQRKELKEEENQKEVNLKEKILDLNEKEMVDKCDNVSEKSDKPLNNNNNNNSAEVATMEELPAQKSLNPFRVCLVPGVFFYAILNVCIKILVVSLLLWLPFYLKQQQLDHHAANIAVLFEFGQIIGAFLLGYFCDKLNKRAALIMPVLLSNVIVFIIVANLGGKEDLGGYYFCLFLIGILLGGPANLISAMMSQDIAQSKEIKEKNKKIASTLVGIIDGSGYIGVALLQLLIPYFLGDFFLVMILFLCFSSVWISPKAIKEILSSMKKPETEANIEKNAV